LNFDLVSHNFGTKFFYFFNNNLFLLEFIAVFIYTYILMKLYLFYIINNLLLIQYKISYTFQYMTNFFISFVYLLITLLVFFSFIPLFNYFLWYDVTTNYYDLVLYFNIILTFFILTLLGLFRLRKLLDYFLIIILIFNTQILTFYFLYFFKWSCSYIRLIHILIVTFLILNLSTHFIDLTFFSLTNEFNSFFYNSIILNNPNIYFNCDNFFIDVLNVYSDVNNILFFNWNTLYLTNFTNINDVLLLFNDDSLFNFYTISSNVLLTHSFIDLNYLTSLYNLFIFVLLLIPLLYKKQSTVSIYY